MKNTKLYLLALIFALIFSACKTSHLSIEVLEPAQVTIPPKLKSVVVVNRSLPKDENKVLNIVEGALTGEEIFLDRNATHDCIRGATDQLKSAPRYDVRGIPAGVDLRGDGAGSFSVPLSWTIVERICNQSAADALITLEVLDSDFLFEDAVETREETVDGKKHLYKVFVKTMQVRVKTGWRVYDAKSKMIVDESIYNDYKDWVGEGASPEAALRALPSKEIAVGEAAYYAGRQFGRRISPSWARVSRQYYVKKHPNLELAKASVQVNDWTKATSLWKDIQSFADPEIAGYANYNLAIAAEVQGNLDKAIEYATKAFRDYGNKQARSYIYQLENRKRAQQKLNIQLGN